MKCPHCPAGVVGDGPDAGLWLDQHIEKWHMPAQGEWGGDRSAMPPPLSPSEAAMQADAGVALEPPPPWRTDDVTDDRPELSFDEPVVELPGNGAPPGWLKATLMVDPGSGAWEIVGAFEGDPIAEGLQNWLIGQLAEVRAADGTNREQLDQQIAWILHDLTTGLRRIVDGDPQPQLLAETLLDGYERKMGQLQRSGG